MKMFCFLSTFSLVGLSWFIILYPERAMTPVNCALWIFFLICTVISLFMHMGYSFNQQTIERDRLKSLDRFKAYIDVMAKIEEMSPNKKGDQDG